MVYKTLYGLVFAFGILLPSISNAEVFRDLSFVAQYNQNFNLQNTCNDNLPVTYNSDSNGYFFANSPSRNVFRTDLRCDRQPFEFETVDISPLYGTSTPVYAWVFSASNQPEPGLLLQDVFGNKITAGRVAQFPNPNLTVIFNDGSNLRGARFTLNDTGYNGIDYAVEGFRIGNGNVYAMIYTTDDLSYINTTGELYDLIDSLAPTPQPGGETSVSFTTNTRFTGLDITGTSTVSISAGHFLDSNEVDSSVPALNPTLVRYSISLSPSLDFSSVSESIIPYTLNAVSTTTTEYTGLSNGVYDLNITFYNNNAVFSGVVPFADSYIYSSFTIASGTLVAVGNTEIYSAVDAETPRYLDCSISNITNCFINALIYTFLPSDTTLNRFLSLRETLATVIPFGYFVYIYDTLNNIELDGTSPLIPTLPFQDAIFTPLRTGVAFILWFWFAFVLYRRFKTIEF